MILAPELEHAPAPAIEFEIDTAPISETYKNGGNPVELAIPAIKVRICLDQIPYARHYNPRFVYF